MNHLLDLLLFCWRVRLRVCASCIGLRSRPSQTTPTWPTADEQPNNGRWALIALVILAVVVCVTIGCIVWLSLQGKSDDATILGVTAIPAELQIIKITVRAVWR